MSSFTIELDDQSWTVGKPTRAVRDRLTDLIVKTAWSQIATLREVIPDAFAASAKEFTRAIEAKEYNAGGKAWATIYTGPEGSTLMLLAMLQEAHPTATIGIARRLIAERRPDVDAAFAVLVPGFFLMVADQEDTPPEYRQWFKDTAGKIEASFTTPPKP